MTSMNNKDIYMVRNNSRDDSATSDGISSYPLASRATSKLDRPRVEIKKKTHLSSHSVSFLTSATVHPKKSQTTPSTDVRGRHSEIHALQKPICQTAVPTEHHTTTNPDRVQLNVGPLYISPRQTNARQQPPSRQDFPEILQAREKRHHYP